MLNESGVVFQSHMRACLGTEPSDLSSPSWDRIFLEALKALWMFSVLCPELFPKRFGI